MKDIRTIAYEKYKLDWIIQHRYTLNDLIHSVAEYMEDSDEPLVETVDMWEEDCGFNGEIWACYDEFLDSEYQDIKYMSQLLTTQEFGRYVEDKEN